MEKSIDSLVSIIEENAKRDPVSRRILATATISHKFATLVRGLRLSRQLTEAQLADIAGCSPDVIISLENPTPENIPGIENMVSVAEALGYEINIDVSPVCSDVNESIVTVAVDSGEHVRLPDNVEVEKDSEAFHGTPIQVKSDDS